MYFTTNARRMELFCAKLDALAQPSPLQQLLRDVLWHVRDHAWIFDYQVSRDSPFFVEFFHALALGDTGEDSCFGMLECLVIFCREKTLRAAAEQPAAPEYALLRHFERSGIWEDPALETLVGQWYWTVLPGRCASAHSAGDISAAQ